MSFVEDPEQLRKRAAEYGFHTEDPGERLIPGPFPPPAPGIPSGASGSVPIGVPPAAETYQNPFKPKKETPIVRLARMKAAALAEAGDEKRAEDSAAFPFISRDMEATIAHQKEMQAELARVRANLLGEAAPTMQAGELSEGQMTAALIASLFGGAKGFNDAIGAGYDQADGAAKRQYAEALDRFERRQKGHALDYENTQRMIQADDETMRLLRKELIDAVGVQKKQEFDQKILDDKQASEAEKIRLNNETKLRIAEAKNLIQRDGQLAKMGPRGRFEWALNNGYSESEAADLAAWTPTEVNQMAGASLKDAQTGLTTAKTQTEDATREHKVKNLVSQYTFRNLNADHLSKKLAVFDEVHAAAMAKAYAYVDGVKSLTLDRIEDNERAEAKIAIDGMRGGLKAAHDQANDARKRVQDLEDELMMNGELTGDQKIAIRKEIEEAKKQVAAAQSEYGELAKEIQDVVNQLGDDPAASSGIDVSGGAGAIAGSIGRLPAIHGASTELTLEEEQANAKSKAKPFFGGLGARLFPGRAKKEPATSKKGQKKRNESKGIKYGG